MLQIFQAASDRKNNWCSRLSSCPNLVSQIRSCCCCWKFWLVWNPDVAVYNVHLHLDRYHDSTDQSRVQVCSCGISKSFGSPYTSPFGESVLPTFWRKNTKINTIWNVNLSFNCVFWRWKGQSGSVGEHCAFISSQCRSVQCALMVWNSDRWGVVSVSRLDRASYGVPTFSVAKKHPYCLFLPDVKMDMMMHRVTDHCQSHFDLFFLSASSSTLTHWFTEETEEKSNCIHTVNSLRKSTDAVWKDSIDTATVAFCHSSRVTVLVCM